MVTREFFPTVKKTVMPRPVVREETDVLGQAGRVTASRATIYGPNWFYDHQQDLIEIYDAGAALVFRDVLPRKDKYAREGLYLRLAIAYRTTENANANIRTFSGNHVTLPNSVHGAMYIDPATFYYITDDMTININSIYSNEKLWIQRVDWEWMSKVVVYEDEVAAVGLELKRGQAEIEALYGEREVTDATVKDFLIDRIRRDYHFSKRCLALMSTDRLLERDLVSLYRELNVD